VESDYMTKAEIKKYLPKHRLDNFYMEELNNLDDASIKKVLNELLVWVKNMNVAVSVDIAALLSKRPKVVLKTFKEHLEDPKIEAVYKYNIIAHIIQNFEEAEIKMYQKELERLANKPTKQEKYAEIDILAKKLLA